MGFDARAAALWREVRELIEAGEGAGPSEEAIRILFTAAVKAYAARTEAVEREFSPFLEGEVTATEAVTALCAVMRAVNLNPFDVSMWYRRVAPAAP